MRPENLFLLTQQNHYTTAGLDVDYCIIKDEENFNCYLIFQGSRQPMDWKINFSFPVKPYRNQERPLLFHGGYVRAWKSCNDRIIEELLAACEGGLQPVIIGHSYSGAIALLAAEDLNFRTGMHPIVYTFGAPKAIFSKATMREVRGSCLLIKNYIHVNDLVPMLPPLPGYKHANPCKVGLKDKCIFKVFNVKKYHFIYGNYSLYI